MTRKDKATRKMLMIAGVAIAVLIGGGLTFLELQASRREAAAAAALWTVEGPPCATTTHVVAPTRVNAFGDVTFTRERGGGVNCNTIQEDGASVPVCMFLTPGALRVATDAGSYDFAPGQGRHATVYIRDGKPECLVAVNQTLFAVGSAAR